MPYTYFLEVVLCWTIFYGFYYAFLRYETFFRWNRAYLLITLISGLLLPLWEISTSLAIIPQTIVLPEVTVGTGSDTNFVANNNNLNSVFSWWLLLYCAGMLMVIIQLIFACKRILFFVKTGERERFSDYELVHLTTLTAPFSFGRWLFLNKNLIQNERELQQILLHERAHIQQRHSWDILFLEIIRIVFWWCPLVYWYKRSLRSVHEYLADAAVLPTTNRKSYGQFLLQHLQPLPSYSVVNHFHSQIKLRIVMLTKTPSQNMQKIKYLLFIPLFAAVAFFTACEKEVIAYDAGKIQQQFTQIAEATGGEVTAAAEADLMQLKELHPQQATDLQLIFDRAFDLTDGAFDNSVVYKQADEMPLFAACEDKSAEDKMQCSNTALLTYIYSNIKYPEAARKAEIEGTVVLKFVVDKAGRTQQPNIVRSVHTSLDEAVMEVYNKMEKEHIWIPGKKDGEVVNVAYHLPVKFKLE